ncbi:MAG: CoA transferase [Acidobacteria bacterium]|nr:CoA transferase [Acidobacteriota bacterium]
MHEKKCLVRSPRVLDMTNRNGHLCGRILADLGADVVKVERPGGDPDRRIGPFYRQTFDRERSLLWFAYNANKRGITLNLDTGDGRQILKTLADKADFLIESFPPGTMDELGLGYAALAEINPRMIYTSITPFGQTGPYKNFKASDLVVMAMSGLLYMTGRPGEAPLRISFPQSFLLAAAHAAAASMIAYFHRETTGRGQHVDVSARECVLWEISNAIPSWKLNRKILKRAGSYMSGRWANIKQKLLWKCKDGYVVFYILSGGFGVKTNRGIVAWLQEEGLDSELLTNVDWNDFDMSEQTQETQNQMEAPIAELFSRHTKAELYNEALKRKIMLSPVSTARDICENTQLHARNFWVEVDHPEIPAGIPYPGPFARLSETPLASARRAPLPGEHNLEIYEKELAFSKRDLRLLHQSGII